MTLPRILRHRQCETSPELHSWSARRRQRCALRSAARRRPAPCGRPPAASHNQSASHLGCQQQWRRHAVEESGCLWGHDHGALVTSMSHWLPDWARMGTASAHLAEGGALYVAGARQQHAPWRDAAVPPRPHVALSRAHDCMPLRRRHRVHALPLCRQRMTCSTC